MTTTKWTIQFELPKIKKCLFTQTKTTKFDWIITWNCIYKYYNNLSKRETSYSVVLPIVSSSFLITYVILFALFYGFVYFYLHSWDLTSSINKQTNKQTCFLWGLFCFQLYNFQLIISFLFRNIFKIK
jgi:hypothetical protein